MSNADNHVSESGLAYVSLRRRDRWRILVWGKLARLTEAKWLEANGWFQTPEGWLPPEWHPKSPERWVQKGWKRPPNYLYDQNHAANSQRKYCGVTLLPCTRKAKELPAYPTYVRWAPYQFVVVVLAVAFPAVVFFQAPPTWAIVLAGALLLCVSFAIARSQQRDLEREYVEDILRRSDR